MDENVEARFQRIEQILEKSAKRNDLFQVRYEEKLDRILSHLELTAQMLQDIGSLSRETRKTLDALTADRDNRRMMPWDDVESN